MPLATVPQVLPSQNRGEPTRSFPAAHPRQQNQPPFVPRQPMAVSSHIGSNPQAVMQQTRASYTNYQIANQNRVSMPNHQVYHNQPRNNNVAPQMQNIQQSHQPRNNNVAPQMQNMQQTHQPRNNNVTPQMQNMQQTHPIYYMQVAPNHPHPAPYYQQQFMLVRIRIELIPTAFTFDS